MKKFTALLLAALCVCTLLMVGCDSNPTTKDPKIFTAEGMTIILTEGFKLTEAEGYTLAYDSSAIAILALREEFTLMPGAETLTIEEYAELVIAANQFTNIPIQTADGLTWFEYDFENTDINKTYHYYSYLFKTADSFWMVQFACYTKNTDMYEDAIKSYAKSIMFS